MGEKCPTSCAFSTKCLIAALIVILILTLGACDASASLHSSRQLVASLVPASFLTSILPEISALVDTYSQKLKRARAAPESSLL
jgi:hypothetical protein